MTDEEAFQAWFDKGGPVASAFDIWQAASRHEREDSAKRVPTPEAVCAEFDRVSGTVHGWSTLSSVNAAWHAFKCGVAFVKNSYAGSLPKQEG